MLIDDKHPSQAWRKVRAAGQDWALGISAVAGVCLVVLAAVAGATWLRSAVHFEWSWEWWLGAYVVVGLIAAVLGALGTFGGLWYWATSRYALGGFVLGWVPSGVAAVVAFFVLVFLWLPILAVVIWASRA